MFRASRGEQCYPVKAWDSVERVAGVEGGNWQVEGHRVAHASRLQVSAESVSMPGSVFNNNSNVIIETRLKLFFSNLA